MDYLALFKMPKPVKITGRTSSITNSFINGIIPVVAPTNDEVETALSILGMLEDVQCAYCGDTHTEWDHLRPLVVGKKPTGYISEIHNLVPSCGKCNQSKGNKHWRDWMFGAAVLSPRAREIPDLERRAERLTAYESWMPPTLLDFEALVDADLWTDHWRNYEQITTLMKEAEATATRIRDTVKQQYLRAAHDPNVAEHVEPTAITDLPIIGQV
ncbi:HNH endonuclease [Janibacter melonis]|uniref:HNH endonuclease n=1 Tax=Janibacter melonis TaxID=262209 RepID=UPI00191A8E55|nr:HNH endonuclease [Janibacter melonis]